MISKINIQKIEKAVGYVFRDKSLLIQAFTRASFVNEAKHNFQSNEVLEFIGDSVLSCAIVTMLLKDKMRRYEHGLFTELDEGDFSNIKSHLSDKGNLSRSMKALGLAKYLVMGAGDKGQRIDEQPSVMEDLFESIVGAIYIDSDGDISKVMTALSSMLDLAVYSSEGATRHSPKGLLQEWCQSKKHRLPMPKYVTEDESGPAHQKMFMRACYIGERIMGRGVGKNRAEADAAAAEAALAALKDEEALGISRSGVDRDAQTKLRNHAAKNKLPYPEFRDLGESPRSTDKNHIYVIECRYLGETTVCEGASKSDARMLCAMKMLEKVVEGKPQAAKTDPNGEVSAKGQTQNKQRSSGKEKASKGAQNKGKASDVSNEKKPTNAKKSPTNSVKSGNEKQRQISTGKQVSKSQKASVAGARTSKK